jgi:uncharacterized protein (DUF1330 family)
MRKWLEVAGTGAVLLAALLACKGADKSGGSASGATAAPADEKPVVVKATELFDDYHKNEVAADEKYKGKRLRVGGQLASIDKDAFNNIVLRLKTSNQFQSVMASMKDSEKAQVSQLSKEQVVVVECKGNGMVIGTPSLQDCTMLKTGVDPASRK